MILWFYKFLILKLQILRRTHVNPRGLDYALWEWATHPPLLASRLDLNREAVCPASGFGGPVPPRQARHRSGQTPTRPVLCLCSAPLPDGPEALGQCAGWRLALRQRAVHSAVGR